MALQAAGTTWEASPSVRYDYAVTQPTTQPVTIPGIPPMFRPMTGVYEPSAIQQLADGRFLVVEDEKAHPFSLVTLHADGSADSTLLDPESSGDDEGLGKLDDLEGLACDQSGHVYAITSHSRDGDGEERKSRHKLVRFDIQSDRITDPRKVKDLKPALAAAHPVLAAAAQVLDVKNQGGLNIEALEITPDQRRLLLGFRSPLVEGRAIIAGIDNPHKLFDTGEAPRIGKDLITLDLAGHGLRGMAYVPALGGYLLIAGPQAKEQSQFRLWFWDGQAHTRARRVTVPSLPGFEHAEGVSPAILDGRPYVVLVSDDGSRESQRCARYLLLEPDQLMVET